MQTLFKYVVLLKSSRVFTLILQVIGLSEVYELYKCFKIKDTFPLSQKLTDT